MSNLLAKLLFKVLKAYDVSITQHTITRTIYTHPDFPSIRSISDAFDKWKVKHVVAKLSLEKLRVLDIPVIAHLKKGEYVWVVQVTDIEVHFWSASGKKRVESCERFEQKWTGAALAIEDVTCAGELDYKKERNKEIKEKIFRYAFVSGCITLLTILTYFSWTSDSQLSLLYKFLLFFVNLAGCFISYILILQEKRQSNRLVSMFCKAGSHIDCNKVTSSRYSKLFEMFSWAELGMAYFATVFLWIAIAPLSTGWLSPLLWLFLLSLPFTVLSLFTQAFLIRKWCLFCCAIVFLLWINTGILYFIFPFGGCIFSVFELSLVALLFLVCTAAVVYASKTVKFGDQYFEQKETARIKYDFKTIQSQLSESRYEIVNVGFAWGNLQSSHEIVLFVSIACSHCGAALKELRRLTEIYPNLGCRLIFAVNTDNFEHKANIIVRHFTSLYKTMTKNEFFDILDAWYTTLNKKLEALHEAFPVSANQHNKEEIEALYYFNQQAKIAYTPTILLNGRLLSQLYSYHDLYGIARTLTAE